jgi:glycosyltransferase involved in cell wall biosynthesis
MKVLFIGKAKSYNDLSSILRAQARSLKEQGVEVQLFCIEGAGIKGYFNSLLSLRRLISNTQFDIYHAHYYLSGIVSILAGARPLVVSLMGSDLISSSLSRSFINLFNRFFWDACIVKSSQMLRLLQTNSHNYLIPNGVDINLFKPLDKAECMRKIGYNPSMKHILFLADPSRREKNYNLAAEAVKNLGEIKAELHVIHDVPYEDIPVYMSASDVLLLTSLHEGSPNVIKEAMACNLSIVATPVGDVPEVINEIPGCFITKFDASEIAEKLKDALSFIGKTGGRDKILQISSSEIALRIIELYKKLLS